MSEENKYIVKYSILKESLDYYSDVDREVESLVES